MQIDATTPAFSDAITAYFDGDHNQAMEALEKLAESNPDDAPSHVILGNVLYARGRLKDALRHFERAVALAPDLGHAYYRLGVCAFRAGYLDRALAAFSRNIELEHHAMTHYWVGQINYFLGRSAAALQEFRTFKDESPESNFANLFMAHILVQQDRYDEAIDLLQELVQATPDLIQAHLLLGQAYKGLYRNTEAIRAFRRTLELSPDNDRAQRELEMLTEVSAP